MSLFQTSDLEITYPGNLGRDVTFKLPGSGTFKDPYRLHDITLQQFVRALTEMNLRNMQCFPDEFFGIYKGVQFWVKNQEIFTFDIEEDKTRRIFENIVTQAQEETSRLFKEN